eukprot:1141866-Pelagomonas_calceolata.AAC.3
MRSESVKRGMDTRVAGMSASASAAGALVAHTHKICRNIGGIKASDAEVLVRSECACSRSVRGV